MSTNAAGRTVWNDKTRSDLLQAIFDVTPPNAQQWEAISVKLHAKGYTYGYSAALQHLQKLKKKDGDKKDGDAPATPKKPKVPAGRAKNLTASGQKKRKQVHVDEDEDEDEDKVYVKKLKLEAQAPNFGQETIGYWKILKTCLEARKDGLDYLWLSEAINSMYAWYRNSAICYAYLSDVLISDPAHAASWSSLDSFRRSRWFRRGWTLQELLAPKTKDMAPLLAEITRVDEVYLLYAQDVRSASIAQRMAADIAYCLLGLFNVNMPLLYGEGAMAFVRLQEEIMKVSDDHSIFAWTWIAELNGKIAAETVAARKGGPSLGYKSNFPANRLDALLRNRMRRDAARPTLLAPDPPSGSLGIFTMTNVGLSISLPIFTHPCMKLFFGVIDDTYNSENDTRTDRWTRTSFPIAPVTVAFRSRSSAVPKLETIQVCRDIQQVSFYFDAFGGTSHRFGFWLLFPQIQETRNLRFHLVDGCVLGNGVYSNHGLFLDPDIKLRNQIIGGLLVFRVEPWTQDTWPWWHDAIIVLFLALEVKKPPDGEFEKTSHHCRISIRPRAPVDAPQLLEGFAAYLQKHLDDGGQSTPKNSPSLGYKDLALHASVECLNDEPLSHSSQSEITLTDLKLWHSEKRVKGFKQFARSFTI
ncbi:HET-domain-containing protein [Xylaria acuta]|nr:HET-domain-containing protein [Xylaria acuta]